MSTASTGQKRRDTPAMATTMAPEKKQKVDGPSRKFSTLQKERADHTPVVPHCFSDVDGIPKGIKRGQPTSSISDAESIKQMFPHTFGQSMIEFSQTPTGSGDSFSKDKPLKVGVVLSGGQAAGGHNVIAGIFDFLKKVHPESQVYGFLNGPKGVFTPGNHVHIDSHMMDQYRNQGGFDIIGSGRDKIETPQQFAGAVEHVKQLGLDGLAVIGGDDSNTNAALLAEHFKSLNLNCVVVGCPKTIDGDLRNEQIETSFGFDTACKVYSELIGNVETDIAASGKYWSFVRLMGRSASHITLECAMQCRPNLTFIGEEVAANKRSLKDLTNELVELVVARAAQGKNYGCVLLPEGLVEFIPEMGDLIKEINELVSGKELDDAELVSKLSPNSGQLFSFLPAVIRRQLMLDRDPHGNVQVAQIATERLMVELCQAELEKRRAAGTYSGTFSPHCHYFGYEGRSGPPSNFDASYCYTLGHVAGTLALYRLTGYMATAGHLDRPVAEWKVGGAPITMMMNLERRHGKNKPVIRKALVELDSTIFKAFASMRESWKLVDHYRSPGPIQYHGASSDLANFTLYYNNGNPRTSEMMAATLSPLQHRVAAEPIAKPVALGQAVRPMSYIPLAHPGELEATSAIRQKLPHVCSLMAGPVDLVAPGSKQHVPTPSRPGPLRLGVVFCGRQTPGGHNVVAGLQNYLSQREGGGALLGFKNGPLGLFSKSHIVVDEKILASFRNQGGYHMLGRSIDRISRPEELAAAAESCRSLDLDGLVLVGGVITATHAAGLAEFFLTNGVKTRVVAVPGNADGDFKHELLDSAFGFDTATRMYSQMVGNLATDCLSAKKYYYFVRLMGRVSSHVGLEVGLATNPNVTLLGEELSAGERSLKDVVKSLADVVQRRAERGKNYGMVIVTSGIVQHMPDMALLIREINEAMAKGEMGKEGVVAKLSPWAAALFHSLPADTQAQLLLERESSGSAQLSQIESEKLLAELVALELKKRKAEGSYKGSFAPLCHFFGYEARSSVPSLFDRSLSFALGHAAGALAGNGLTAMCATVRNLSEPVDDWVPGGVPLVTLMDARKAAVLPTRVDLSGPAFLQFAKDRDANQVEDDYINPGGVQFEGKAAVELGRTLHLEQVGLGGRLRVVNNCCERIRAVCGASMDNQMLLEAAATGLNALSKTLEIIKAGHS